MIWQAENRGRQGWLYTTLQLLKLGVEGPARVPWEYINSGGIHLVGLGTY